MKICLVVCVDDIIEKTQMFGVKYMPVWAYTLASYLRELSDIEISLYDTRLKSKTKTPEADLYLISGINQDHLALNSYLKMMKAKVPNAIYVLGGPIALSYKMAGKLDELYDFDHIYIGDGEQGVVNLVSTLQNGAPLLKVIENHDKFALKDARPMDAELIRATYRDYYGAVIEVSRGCPFLCEFCDIRTKPDNNSANNKTISVILDELMIFCELGLTNILFACDNFIGNISWAEQVCDEIISWKKRTGHSPSFYTWLTINLTYHPRLMKKLKHAGFDMFFIGIESFGVDQLLETAKLQNLKTDIATSIKHIQSYGFIIVAGLIFGFDTDPEDVVDVSLKGIRESGLISGDPSLLMALPTTPLYKRMQLAGRLRDGKLGLGGKKYATNILYLRNKEQMIADFMRFVDEFNLPNYQLARYQNFLATLAPNINVEKKAKGYINLRSLLRLVLKNPSYFLLLAKRFYGISNSWSKISVILKALWLTKNTPSARLSFFYFWLFNWSNSVLKYGDLSESDFDIDSLNRPVTLKDVVPEGYEEDYTEPIPATKIRAQRHATIKSLQKAFRHAVD